MEWLPVAWFTRHRIILLILVAICIAYANHFRNSFHFDDSHTIVDNPAIRRLSNAPTFFTDTKTFSVLPTNRAWRPIVPLSLAIDYWIGGGLQPVAFHASTLLWFLVLVWIVYRLALLIFDLVSPESSHVGLAALTAGIFGLHPVSAETVNYIIQRGDLYAALGSTAGLYLYASRPEWRRYGLYLLPVVAALLAKPPALVFPVLLFAYIRMIERRPARVAVLESLPSAAVSLVVAALNVWMTPPTFNAGAFSPFAYRITQPYVTLRYFESFFLPLHLSADSDLTPIGDWADPRVLAGFAFLGLLIAAAVFTGRRAQLRPIGFGIAWFLIGLAPTAVFALAEVENDHRMFFSFVGLAIGVVWGAGLLLERIKIPVAAVAICVLAACAWGTHVRNRVWLNESTLWHDVTIKSPHNGRGLMNYGLTLMSAGDYANALDYFERALQYTPNYQILEINLGILEGQIHHDQEAERHFQRALALAPGDGLPYYYYARWLSERGRTQPALSNIRRSVAINPSFSAGQELLAQIEKTAAAAPIDPSEQIAAAYLNRSLEYHKAHRFEESIQTARLALRLKPDYAEAYNNIAAANEELGRWDEAIEAAQRAIQLNPDFTLARNNLAWATSQKNRAAASKK